MSNPNPMKCHLIIDTGEAMNEELERQRAAWIDFCLKRNDVQHCEVEKMTRFANEYFDRDESSQLAAFKFAWQARAKLDSWVSVEDKMPNESGTYLVFTAMFETHSAHYSPIFNQFGLGFPKVTHWKRLPDEPVESGS